VLYGELKGCVQQLDDQMLHVGHLMYVAQLVAKQGESCAENSCVVWGRHSRLATCQWVQHLLHRVCNVCFPATLVKVVCSTLAVRCCMWDCLTAAQMCTLC
jgi:hypothetical protein